MSKSWKDNGKQQYKFDGVYIPEKAIKKQNKMKWTRINKDLEAFKK